MLYGFASGELPAVTTDQVRRRPQLPPHRTERERQVDVPDCPNGAKMFDFMAVMIVPTRGRDYRSEQRRASVDGC
jgi:hypothetical protein